MTIDKELLAQMEVDIERELANPKLGHVQRRALQMDRLMIMFMRQASLDHERLDRVENASIVLWMQENPKMTVFIASVILIVLGLVDFREVLAKALGL